MTLNMIGHINKHKVESLCKMFFPCTKIQLQFNQLPFLEEHNIITRVKKGKYHTFLLCIYRDNQNYYRHHCVISNADTNDQKKCDRQLCKVVYSVLLQATGHALPWGILTGIRPVKMVNQLFKQGFSKDEIGHYLKQEFLISEEKLQLCFTIAEKQQPFVNKIRDNTFSLYISIPFCPSRCHYCSFVSHAVSTKNTQNLMEPYVDRLCKELEMTARIAKERHLQLENIYIGGGTPTILLPLQLQKIVNCIEKEYSFKFLKEYTIEAGRPDTITAEKLQILKNAGVTRISINPQTFHNAVLMTIGRKHSVQDTIEKYKMARQIGFETINMDFIAGLPGDTLKQFQESIKKAIQLNPENITVHTLSFKRASDLYTLNGIPSAIDRNTEKMVMYALEQLQLFGYHPYYMYRQKNTIGNLENIGFSKAGTESLYNIYIMEENQTILAVGANAVTKLVSNKGKYIRRIFNYKFPHEYIQQFSEIIKRKEQVNNFYGSKNAQKEKSGYRLCK